jgi:hypothetical protein
LGQRFLTYSIENNKNNTAMLSKYPFTIINRGSKLLLALLPMLWLAPGSNLSAQEEPAAEEKATELISSRMSHSVTQMPGDTIELQALLRAKFEGAYKKIADAGIEFFAIGDEEEISLGEAITNADGIAQIKAKKSVIPVNEEGYMTLSARFSGNEQLIESDGDVSILPASIALEPIAEDSTYAIAVSLTAHWEEEETPLADADISIMVERMVGMLTVGEGTTDEEGYAEISFPGDLTGDDNGNLYITTFIEDYEEYGNLAATTVLPWGKPVSSRLVDLPRALWSPYPPAWLLITFLGFLAFIWGHYIHVLIELVRVKKVAKQQELLVPENDKNQSD